LAIERDIRCPSCEALSVATSSAPTAVTLRQVIVARVDEGESARQIERFVVSRYGSGILLRPPTSGTAGLVWWIPVLLGVIALAALVSFFWRRRSLDRPMPSAADRDLVGRALRSHGGPGAPDASGQASL
jgi:cytochrome c-type biogenesis protein CcmH